MDWAVSQPSIIKEHGAAEAKRTKSSSRERRSGGKAERLRLLVALRHVRDGGGYWVECERASGDAHARPRVWKIKGGSELI